MDDEGNKLHLEKKNKEHLSEPVTVYNFAVEDYHTYFVGENEILVHNICGLPMRAVQRAAVGIGGATDWELYMIKQTQSAWDRITWYLNGQVVNNPFTY